MYWLSGFMINDEAAASKNETHKTTSLFINPSNLLIIVFKTQTSIQKIIIKVWGIKVKLAGRKNNE